MVKPDLFKRSKILQKLMTPAGVTLLVEVVCLVQGDESAGKNDSWLQTMAHHLKW